MKKLLVLIICLFYVPCFAGGVLFQAGGIFDSETFIQTNGVETQTEDDDWTDEAGTPDYDKSTSGLNMQLSECIELQPGDDTSITVTAAAEVWISAKVRVNNDIDNFETFVTIYAGAVRIAKTTIQSGGTGGINIRTEGGTASSTLSAGLTGGSSIYIKLRIKQGTGANAEAELWASSDGTSWGSSVSSTDGTLTGQATKIRFENNADTEIIYVDIFKEKGSDIINAN